MNYNGRTSNQLNKVDALRCAVATLQSFDKRTLRSKNIAELVLAIASSYEAWLNGSEDKLPEGARIPEAALKRMELELAVSGEE